MTTIDLQQGPADEDIGPDVGPIERVPWLTPRYLIVFVIGWVTLFSLGSLFVSNPFEAEPAASATPNYWHVMYLHGLLVSVAGLVALLACQVLRVRARYVRVGIVGGVVAATVLSTVGGIFDKSINGYTVALWTHILGYFALDVILVLTLLGLIGEWRRRAAVARSLPGVAAFLATASMLVAALMGHVAGWIMDFGDRPAFLGSYAHFVGEKLADLEANLIGSHSHEMVVAVMALAASLAALQFGWLSLRGAAKALARVGMAMVAFGVVLMTVVYVAMGFTAWVVPTLFTSAGGTNGIAGDDVATGVFVMAGGLIALAAVVLQGRMSALLRRPVRLATLWAWTLTFLLVVVAGYAIELHETYFGAGAKAPGAAKDAVYTWLHQDIALFLFPAIVVIMLAVEHLVASRYGGAIGWGMIAGTSVAFVGGLVFVFVSPALHGPGYVVAMLGLLLVGLALIATLWGIVRSGRARPSAAASKPVPSGSVEAPAA